MSRLIIPFAKRCPRFWIGDSVYLAISEEPLRGIITTVSFTSGSEMFEVGWCNRESTVHYEFELRTEFTPLYPSNGE